MDSRLLKILKKVYFKKKYVQDGPYLRQIDCGDRFDPDTMTTNYSTDTLNPSDQAFLIKSCYPVNEIVYHTHDQCVDRSKYIIQAGDVTLEKCLLAFICGFESFPRGRQPILSYLFARALPVHKFNEDGYCPICSLKKDNWLQYGEEIFRLYYGYSWNESWENCVIDLEEFSKLPLCQPTGNDISIFKSVIESIRNAPAMETPGRLEQRIRSAKIVPGYEKYRFRGQLIALAELGVMPNAFIKPLYDGFTAFEERCMIGQKVIKNFRSDIPLPLAGWRGDNPIDEVRLNELFGDIIY